MKSNFKYDVKKYAALCYSFSLIIGIAFAGFFALIFTQVDAPYILIVPIFFTFFLLSFLILRLLPKLSVNSRKALLESDLLYSSRHLLLKLESGSSLINSIESVSRLPTHSSVFFKEIIFDISLGVPVEDALQKAIEHSPSKAYIKLLDEIKSSLTTGTDLIKTLKITLDDITRQHLIQIQEYGKKLNPMTMFYMIIGTIMPSLGTAMLVVASSFLQGFFTINFQFLMFIAFFLLVIQVFFILLFKTLKPAVIE